MKTGNVSKFFLYKIASILPLFLVGCISVPKIPPTSFKNIDSKAYCIKTTYQYSRNSETPENTHSYDVEIKRNTQTLNFILGKYNILTDCEKAVGMYKINVKKTSPLTIFSWRSPWIVGSIITLGIIPYKEDFQVEVSILDITKNEFLDTFLIDFSTEFSVTNTEAAKEIKKYNTSEYGSEDHFWAPIGAALAIKIRDKIK